MLSACILSLALLVTGTSAHGVLVEPLSRNMLGRVNNEEYCPHCFNAGGPGSIQQYGGSKVFPYPETSSTDSRHPVCGDKWTDEEKYDEPGEITRTYKKGQVIGIELTITAHHAGFFEFWICDEDQVTFECLSKHHLKRAVDPKDRSPIDPAYPERYYLEPLCVGDSPYKLDSENYSDLIGIAGQRVTMSYQLPEDLTCEHCVLRWWWGSGNSCNIGNSERYDAPFEQCGSYLKDVPRCDASVNSYPEEFWNCADIAILDSDDVDVVETLTVDVETTPPVEPTTTSKPSSTVNDPTCVTQDYCAKCVTTEGFAQCAEDLSNGVVSPPIESASTSTTTAETTTTTTTAAVETATSTAKPHSNANDPTCVTQDYCAKCYTTESFEQCAEDLSNGILTTTTNPDSTCVTSDGCSNCYSSASYSKCVEEMYN